MDITESLNLPLLKLCLNNLFEEGEFLNRFNNVIINPLETKIIDGIFLAQYYAIKTPIVANNFFVTLMEEVMFKTVDLWQKTIGTQTVHRTFNYVNIDYDKQVDIRQKLSKKYYEKFDNDIKPYILDILIPELNSNWNTLQCKDFSYFIVEYLAKKVIISQYCKLNNISELLNESNDDVEGDLEAITNEFELWKETVNDDIGKFYNKLLSIISFLFILSYQIYFSYYDII